MAIEGSLEMNSQLAGLMECPVCLEYLTPTISQCINGHNVCSKCLPSLTNCPVCREPPNWVRNLFAEQLAGIYEFPCLNMGAGCEVRSYLKNMSEHLSRCPRRKYKCELVPCDWNGRCDEIKDHVKQQHEDEYYEGECNSVKMDEFPDKYNNDIIVDDDDDDDDDYIFTKMLFSHEEIFVMYIKYKESKLFAAVKYIGQMENAKKFLFEFELSSKDHRRRVCHRNICHSDHLLSENIFGSANCFMVPTDIAMKFVMNNTLIIKVRVMVV